MKLLLYNGRVKGKGSNKYLYIPRNSLEGVQLEKRNNYPHPLKKKTEYRLCWKSYPKTEILKKWFFRRSY